jgi:hypothetical protein
LRVKNVLTIFLLLFCAGARAQNVHEFTAKSIGWTISLPNGWKQHSREELKDLMGADTGGIPLSLYKDGNSSIIAMCDPTGKVTTAEYKKRVDSFCIKLKAGMEDGMDIPTDTARTKEQISGQDFDVFDVVFHTPAPEYTVIFSSYMNGKDLQISIACNSEAERNALVEAVRRSRFE